MFSIFQPMHSVVWHQILGFYRYFWHLKTSIIVKKLCNWLYLMLNKCNVLPLVFSSLLISTTELIPRKAGRLFLNSVTSSSSPLSAMTVFAKFVLIANGFRTAINMKYFVQTTCLCLHTDNVYQTYGTIGNYKRWI